MLHFSDAISFSPPSLFFALPHYFTAIDIVYFRYWVWLYWYYFHTYALILFFRFLFSCRCWAADWRCQAPLWHYILRFSPFRHICQMLSLAVFSAFRRFDIFSSLADYAAAGRQPLHFLHFRYAFFASSLPPHFATFHFIFADTDYFSRFHFSSRMPAIVDASLRFTLSLIRQMPFRHDYVAASEEYWCRCFSRLFSLPGYAAGCHYAIIFSHATPLRWYCHAIIDGYYAADYYDYFHYDTILRHWFFSGLSIFSPDARLSFSPRRVIFTLADSEQQRAARCLCQLPLILRRHISCHWAFAALSLLLSRRLFFTSRHAADAASAADTPGRCFRLLHIIFFHAARLMIAISFFSLAIFSSRRFLHCRHSITPLASYACRHFHTLIGCRRSEAFQAGAFSRIELRRRQCAAAAAITPARVFASFRCCFRQFSPATLATLSAAAARFSLHADIFATPAIRWSAAFEVWFFHTLILMADEFHISFFTAPYFAFRLSSLAMLLRCHFSLF